MLNSTIVKPTWVYHDIDFVSNAENYYRIQVQYDGEGDALLYNSTGVYGFPGSMTGSNAWTNQAYRTINFSTSPTGDLLTWLQANGTKPLVGAVTHKVSEIAGYWTLNETITAPTADISETFNWMYCTSSDSGSFKPNGFVVTATDVKIQAVFSLVTNTLYENNSWRDMTYRYIAIPNSETEISEAFFNWFVANAVKRSETFTVTIVNNVDVAFRTGLRTGATTSPVVENIPANTTVELNIQLSTDIIQAGAYMSFTFAGSLWGNQNIAATGGIVIFDAHSMVFGAVLASTGTITLTGYDD